ncbi:Endothelin-converting enzyme 1 [Hypsizygus marmoreus]|uniref:Endothelin-converting enzyme 1 n=1 Tax=Hypsizygus marmoreus TaxID=39966 RepID=A0A369JQ94_HYPMA|nr:Endothelin-converting enzyme 1 [Hypsizygus marmoreus]
MDSLARTYTPIPNLQLALLCFLRVLDPLNFTQIFPYVNQFMNRLKVVDDPSKVGFYSGLLESSFAISQLLAIYPWGFVSDTIGRRPVILIGVAGLAVSTGLFGLSESFLSALASRAVAGLFSGNVAVIPSVLCDITDSSNQSFAFAFFGLWWPVGAILGPLIGGVFSNAASKYPFFFTHRLFHLHPYFLPSFIAAMITTVGFAFSFFFLKESLKSHSHGAVKSMHKYGGTGNQQSVCEPHTVRKLFSIPVIRALCISGFALSFISTAFDVVFVLFCYSPISNGGLGFSESEIGYALAGSGVMAALLQLIFMPALLRRFDHAKLYHFCMTTWVYTFMALPPLNFIARQGLQEDTDKIGFHFKAIGWMWIAVTLLIARVGFLGYSVNMLLIKAHSPSPSALGSTYALVQFFICLSRAGGPAFVSLLFTASADVACFGRYGWVLVMTLFSSRVSYVIHPLERHGCLDVVLRLAQHPRVNHKAKVIEGRYLTANSRSSRTSTQQTIANMADSLARPSTDQETAPLLRDPDAEDRGTNGHDSSFTGRVGSIAQEPFTPLTRILLILALVLLLLSSVFIGLFAGAQHKLKLEQGRHGGGDGGGGNQPATTVTTTVTATSASIGTTTRFATTTTTTTVTAVPPPGPTAPPREETCLTPQCILLSGSILSSLDISQDPCENFYDFATGGWLRDHPLPADKSSYGNFEALAQQNKQVVQRILESEASTSSFQATDDANILRKLRDFYSSCSNEDLLDDIGTTPLLQFVQTLKHLFRSGNSKTTPPSEDSGSEVKTDLTAALAYLHSQGIDALFSFDIEGDIGVDPNQMVLWFSQASLGLPSKEYYKDKSILAVYRSVVERLILALVEEEESLSQTQAPILATNQDSNVWPPWPWPPWGDGEDDKDKPGKPVNQTRRAHELSKKVVDLERRLAKASLDLDILYQDPIRTYNPWPLSNLTEAVPHIDFPTYFSTFTPRNFPQQVIVTYPAYPASLASILDATPAEVIEAYLVVRAALTLSPHLGMGTEAWRAQRFLQETLTGIKKGAVGDRSEYCIGKVEETLGFAVGRYFVNQTFGGDSREKGTKVITDIVKSFQASLPRIDWMDKKSAHAAAEKANAIRVKVGFPLSPDTRDPGSIAQYYSGLKVDGINFFDNMLSAAKSDEFKKWLQLGKRRNQDSWEMYPSMVNAYFNPPANEIVFPAGILQPPFFQVEWPSYISYGAFGHVAAHELTHAFDSAGRLYNQAGKLEEWWTNSTSEGFKHKQDCIVKQYSAYTIDDGKGGKIHVNGNLTSGENIGDTGLIQAYRAWREQYEVSFKAGHEPLLPGLIFTREQLFFISFARIWARAMKPAAAVQRIRTDPHSPSRYRVDGTVFNIPEFAKAFKCSKKAKLNPPAEAQCQFW